MSCVFSRNIAIVLHRPVQQFVINRTMLHNMCSSFFPILQGGALMISSDHQVVVFTTEDKELACSLLDIQEVIIAPPINSYPDAGSCVEGVINLRESIVKIVSLKKLLGLESSTKSKRETIVIIDRNGSSFGLLVDNVKEVVTLSNVQDMTKNMPCTK